MARDEKVFSEDAQEDNVLENLGYQQELKRSFGLLGMIGFSFSIVTSWSALGGVCTYSPSPCLLLLNSKSPKTCLDGVHFLDVFLGPLLISNQQD